MHPSPTGSHQDELLDGLHLRLLECQGRSNAHAPRWSEFDRKRTSQGLPVTSVRVTGFGHQPTLILSGEKGDVCLSGEECLLLEEALKVWRGVPKTRTAMLCIDREPLPERFKVYTELWCSEEALAVFQITEQRSPPGHWRIHQERSLVVPPALTDDLTVGIHTVNRWQLTEHLARRSDPDRDPPPPGRTQE